MPGEIELEKINRLPANLKVSTESRCRNWGVGVWSLRGVRDQRNLFQSQKIVVPHKIDSRFSSPHGLDIRSRSLVSGQVAL